MKILGVFYFKGYSDPSAAILIDGEIIAFAEEERFIRNKHAINYFPSRAIKYVLSEANLEIIDIDKITIGWDCNLHEDGTLKMHFEKLNKVYEPTVHDLQFQHRRISSLSATPYKIDLIKNLNKIYGNIEIPKVEFINHHFAHAIMTYSHSGFNKTLVLIVDGSGELTSTTWWLAENGKLNLLNDIKIPHSLGWFYSAFTEYLGFEAYDGEYKVMGLAAYGYGDSNILKKLNKMIWYDGKGGFETDPHLFSMGPRSYSDYYCDLMLDHIGQEPRSKQSEINQWHINVAYGVQKVLEQIVQKMTQYWAKRTGVRLLSIAGGVGLNVKMNGNLLSSAIIDDIFIHPLCSDTGISIGSAMACEYLNGTFNIKRIKHVNFGPSFKDSEVEYILKSCKIAYQFDNNIYRKVAQLIANGKIIGWFQGRMEAGPRALGNRSILADPRNSESRDRVNEVVKFREFWRPFCPSMTKIAAEKYLINIKDAPFMITTFSANDKAETDIPAVVHIDSTSRIQIVGQENNKYFNLIKEFGKITGIPVLLNTSFNIKGEPIVCTPHDAIRTFYATGLDALAIGSFLIIK